MTTSFVILAVHVIELALVIRVILRPHRDPASRIAWIAVITALPVVGILAYLLFGEVNIGRRRVARLRKVMERMPEFPACAPGDDANFTAGIPQAYEHLFRMGTRSVGLSPLAAIPLG